MIQSILFCTCGKRMAIAHKVRKNKIDTFYKCANHEKNPIECPNSNFIQYNFIKEIIHKEIMKIIDKVRQDDRSKSNSSEIKRTEARLNQLVKIASKLYEDYTADLI
ncbi:MAG: recombinase zinc beta ribbon domain-containing protein [Anaeroplasma sp.]